MRDVFERNKKMFLKKLKLKSYYEVLTLNFSSGTIDPAETSWTSPLISGMIYKEC